MFLFCTPATWRGAVIQQTVSKWLNLQQPAILAERGKKQHHLPEASLHEDLAAAGHTQEDIARILGVDQSTVSRWICTPAKMADMHKKQHNLPEASLHEDLAAAGHTQEDIARQLGVAQRTVSDWLRLPEPAKMADSGKKQHNLPVASLHEAAGMKSTLSQEVSHGIENLG